MRVRLTVAYDGAEFHGFARNDPYPTVGGWLEDQIGLVSGAPVSITCAGRTDRGVHARAQVVTFDTDGALDLARLQRSLNKMGGGRVVVTEAQIVDARFDAGFSAMWRRYRYLVRNAAVPDPFTRHTAWWVAEPLDLAAMIAATPALVGHHDFAAFCRKAKEVPGAAHPPSTVRQVLDAGWAGRDGSLTLEIRANAFCHQMVRSIVGLLVDVGRGAIDPEAVPAIVATGDRAGVRTIAPPHGLCLWDVGYD